MASGLFDGLGITGYYSNGALCVCCYGILHLFVSNGPFENQ